MKTSLELEDNGEYLRDVEQMEDAYRIKYISVVFLYILLCLLVYHYYYSKEKELKDEQVLFCKGTCIERDWRERSTEGEYNVKCHLSIMLEDGNIMRKIQLAPYSGKDVEIGQNIILVKFKNGDSNPSAYHYRIVEENIVLY